MKKIDFYSESIPKLKDIISIDSSDKDIEIVKFRFESVKNNEIYSVMAYPKKEGSYPAILVLHGGTQNADIVSNRVAANAKKGFVSMASELPYIATPTENSKGEWVRKDYLYNVFSDTDDPEKCSLFETVFAAIDSFNFLSKPYEVIEKSKKIEIQRENIGLTGFSWGGWLVTMLCGILGERAKAGFSNYGCGYYDLSDFWNKYFSKMSDDNKAVWLENYDAGRMAKNITSPFFIASPTNDTFFYPPAVMKTIDSIASQNKGFVFSPNSHHCIKVKGGTSENPNEPHGCEMENIYFDFHLKNKGLDFPKVTLKNDSLIVNTDDVSVDLIYSEANVNYPERKWKTLDKNFIIFENGIYKAKIPENLKKSCEFYYLVTDNKRNVTVSSKIFKF